MAGHVSSDDQDLALPAAGLVGVVAYYVLICSPFMYMGLGYVLAIHLVVLLGIATVCAVLGFRVPVYAWLYGPFAMGGFGLGHLVQFLTGEGNLNVLPGLVIAGVIALPMALAGPAGARIRAKRRRPSR
jgi:hypothetical protein